MTHTHNITNKAPIHAAVVRTPPRRQQQQLPCLHRPTTDQDKAMNHTPEALQLANQLEANYAHVYAGLAPAAALVELAQAAAAALRSQHARIADLEAENSRLRILASGGIELFERYSTFKAKCEELEAMLDALSAAHKFTSAIEASHGIGSTHG